MKRLLSGLLCLVAPFANALQVSGQGATFEEAKQNGDNKSAWYWKNRDARLAYNRAYYQRKKLAEQGNK